jgi:hypothetical protein
MVQEEVDGQGLGKGITGHFKIGFGTDPVIIKI